MEIGAQLFTLREYCKDLESFSETLKRVADIGYKDVQVSGTCRFAPQWLKNELDKNGLKCVVTHTPAERILNETLTVANEHTVFGCENIGLGIYRFNEENPQEGLDDFLNKYQRVADVFAENGKYFMYHNHALEFIKHNGKIIMDHSAEKWLLSERVTSISIEFLKRRKRQEQNIC